MRVLWNEMRANIYYCTLDTYFFNANSKFETHTLKKIFNLNKYLDQWNHLFAVNKYLYN